MLSAASPLKRVGGQRGQPLYLVGELGPERDPKPRPRPPAPAGPPRHRSAARPAWPRISPHSPPRSTTQRAELGIVGQLSADLLQPRAGELTGSRLALHRPGSQIPRPVPGMIRPGAHAVRLAAPPEGLVHATFRKSPVAANRAFKSARCCSRSPSGLSTIRTSAT
jgi:hypothetical protein